MKPSLRGIYGITDDALLSPDTVLPAIEAALLGGIKLLQYRCKSLALLDKTEQARRLLALCERFSIPLIINDDMQLCADIGANGVHLGQRDGDCATARKLLGAEAIIGVTCHDSLEKAEKAADAGADYVAFGRFFPSQTKPDASPAALEILSQAHEKIDIPIVAIGGINPENGASLIAAGADMLAVINGLFGAAENDSHEESGQDFNKQILARARELDALFSESDPDLDSE
jgi:thiamine-phosphate pyrophosphorylase